MRNFQDSLLHSATDLNAYLACPHAVALDLRKLCDPASLPDRADEDEGAKLVADTGVRHEAAYLEQLQEEMDVAVIAGDGPLPHRIAATSAAMASGASIIYQAAFLDPPWHGFADFLRRVEEPSSLGCWSDEPVDTKLAREWRWRP